MKSPSSPRIDAHHHFWKYDAIEYGWIDDSMKAIRRDFLPQHLTEEIRAAGIDGVISVQARQTLEETDWLLNFAERNDFISGVVGWVPLRDAKVEAMLERSAANRKLKGVRHILQAEPEGYMLGKDFHAGIDSLRSFNLAYDILVYEHQLSQAIELVDRHPHQVFVLDHIAKPRIREHVLSPWRKNIMALAQRPNVYSKISGVVTEADYLRWTETDLQPYLEVALEAFGPHRLMFGSDWPVCLVACSYRKWFETVSGFIARLSSAEQDQILGQVAIKAYRISPSSLS